MTLEFDRCTRITCMNISGGRYSLIAKCRYILIYSELYIYIYIIIISIIIRCVHPGNYRSRDCRDNYL